MNKSLSLLTLFSFKCLGKRELLRENERMNNEIQMLDRKCEDLNRNLCETVGQRDKERSEITKLNEKLRQLQFDTEKVIRTLKGMHPDFFQSKRLNDFARKAFNFAAIKY